jgi:tetratricopeptide (TPR) repeat protein
MLFLLKGYFFPMQEFYNFLTFFRLLPFLLTLPLSCTMNKNETRLPAMQPVTINILDDSLSLKSACDSISLSVLNRFGDKGKMQRVLFYRLLDKTADSLSTLLGKDAAGYLGAKAILDVVYNNWKIAFDPREEVIETLLPHLLFQRKSGNCVGVSLILLMLAERCRCPLFGVVLPTHFFCRYDDGVTRVNIEPNKTGFCHPDDYYQSKYFLQEDKKRSLDNLTKNQTIGVLYYTLGTLSLKRNDFSYALACLKESYRRIPFFNEAKGNYALALAVCGKSDTAMTLLGELFDSFPNFKNLAANYGAVAMTTGQSQKALQIFKKGLYYFPSDPQLLVGFAAAYSACRKTDSLRSVRNLLRH